MAEPGGRYSGQKARSCIDEQDRHVPTLKENQVFV